MTRLLSARATDIRLRGILALLFGLPIASMPLYGKSEAATRQQAISTESAAIRGQVRFADTGEPASDVDITVDYGLGIRSFAKTDTNGRYEFPTLQAGRVGLRASRPGYVPMSYGQARWLDSARIDIRPDQILEANFLLRKEASIVVRVADESGKPFLDARVAVFQASYSARGRQLVRAISIPVRGLTNGQGELRVVGLPPGDYYIRVLPPRSPVDGRLYPDTFYPGTIHEADAKAVSVTFGQEAAVNVTLTAGPPVSVSGTVLTVDGAASSVDDLKLMDLGSGSFRFLPGTEAGRFTVERLPPGDYYLFSGVHRMSGKLQHIAARFSVGAESLTGLTVKALEPGTAAGRVVFDSGVPPNVKPGGLQFQMPDVDRTEVSNLFDQAAWTFNNDWSFSITSIQGGRRIFRPRVETGWFVKAVMLNGKEVTDIPIDFNTVKSVTDLQIILTQRQTTVTGTVLDGTGTRAKEFSAIVFSADSERWTSPSRFIATQLAYANGAFSITGLPSGSYLAVAVDFLQSGAEFDPQFLSRLRDEAVPFTLTEAESKSLQVKLVDR